MFSSISSPDPVPLLPGIAGVSLLFGALSVCNLAPPDTPVSSLTWVLSSCPAAARRGARLAERVPAFFRF